MSSGSKCRECRHHCERLNTELRVVPDRPAKQFNVIKYNDALVAISRDFEVDVECKGIAERYCDAECPDNPLTTTLELAQMIETPTIRRRRRQKKPDL